MTELRIHHRHMLTRTGRPICRSARRTFERAGVDYDALTRPEGLAASELRRIRHPLVARVIAWARREAEERAERGQV